MFNFHILILDKTCRLLHLAAPDSSMHVLTLVVRCGFPKPLTVDPMTISLVGCNRACFLVWCSAAFLLHWLNRRGHFLLFTEAGRQRKPSHMDKLQPERGLLVQAQQQKWSRQHNGVIAQGTTVSSIRATAKTQREHTHHTLGLFWSLNHLERKPLNTHTLPAWFSSCHFSSLHRTHTHTETMKSVNMK